MFISFLVALQDFKEKLRNSQLICSFIFYLVKYMFRTLYTILGKIKKKIDIDRPISSYIHNRSFI